MIISNPNVSIVSDTVSIADSEVITPEPELTIETRVYSAVDNTTALLGNIGLLNLEKNLKLKLGVEI